MSWRVVLASEQVSNWIGLRKREAKSLAGIQNLKNNNTVVESQRVVESQKVVAAAVAMMAMMATAIGRIPGTVEMAVTVAAAMVE